MRYEQTKTTFENNGKRLVLSFQSQKATKKLIDETFMTLTEF